MEARAMLAAGNGGAIVNVGSVNSFLGFATGSAHCTSKHGLIGLTTCVSARLASKGILVNLVCPGIVGTPMQKSPGSSASCARTTPATSPARRSRRTAGSP
jgi:NAD(P)-dependent dehydrogenase (short-subunit alcohol dehydrogenase family)